MIDITEYIEQGEIPLATKREIMQKCTFTTDTFPDKVRKLKQELLELEMAIDDAKRVRELVSGLKVV